jgi:hypothetical protein
MMPEALDSLVDLGITPTWISGKIGRPEGTIRNETLENFKAWQNSHKV